MQNNTPTIYKQHSYHMTMTTGHSYLKLEVTSKTQTFKQHIALMKL